MNEKSTNEIRMIAVQAIDQQAKTCEAQRARLSDRIAQLAEHVDALDQGELINDMRAAWAEFKGEVGTQIRITWALLFLVLSGLVSIAFAVWKNVI